MRSDLRYSKGVSGFICFQSEDSEGGRRCPANLKVSFQSSPVDVFPVFRRGLLGLGVLPADDQDAGVVVEIDVDLVAAHAWTE